MTSVKFETMIKNLNTEPSNTRYHVLYGSVSFLNIALVITYGVLANNNEQGGGKENNYVPRYFLSAIYLMSFISIFYLCWALRKLYVVMKIECANKLEVNNTAIVVHLVCFSLYMITSLFSTTTNVFKKNWISSIKAKTALFIVSSAFSSIS